VAQKYQQSWDWFASGGFYAVVGVIAGGIAINFFDRELLGYTIIICGVVGSIGEAIEEKLSDMKSQMGEIHQKLDSLDLRIDAAIRVSRAAVPNTKTIEDQYLEDRYRESKRD
jgi:hypothetical protein